MGKVSQLLITNNNPAAGTVTVSGQQGDAACLQLLHVHSRMILICVHNIDTMGTIHNSHKVKLVTQNYIMYRTTALKF